ncbi:MAG: ribosome biogenesis GTPase Der [Phycisphaerales bacterium]|jgi:GTP-binding protein|nr:ribosome biogenesis GTPase Der [Phycisphaerales bacterium]
MPLPRVAIVGRPNVGKSSLLNMIAGRKVSIVEDQPGVTRDRVASIVELASPDGVRPPKTVELIDTGGFGVYVAEGQRFDEVGEDLTKLTGAIERQIGEAVATSDVVLFAVDTQAGLTPRDWEIAKMLREGTFTRVARLSVEEGVMPTRRSSAPEGDPAHAHHATPNVHVVATKVDGPKWEAHAYELAALGFGEPIMCSASNNYMRRDMLDAIYDLIPDATDEDKSNAPRADMSFAIVGKRNAGKSTLVNALAGEDRVIVSEIAGTTRDAVDVHFRMETDEGLKDLVAIDTAGLRRRKSFQGRVEWWAFDRLQRSIERADVVLLLIDATSDISQVDEHLAQMVQESFKPVVIVINKWDLADGQAGPSGKVVTPEDYEAYVRKALGGLTFAPIAFMSAALGDNVQETLELAMDLNRQTSARIGTGELNRIIRPIIERQGPPSKIGRQVKLHFVSQVATNPPTIVMIASHPELFRPAYRRFLLNRLREVAPYPEVPIRLIIRGRSREEYEAHKRALREGQRAAAPDATLGIDDEGRILPRVVAFSGDETDRNELAAFGIDIDDLLKELPDEAGSYFDDE